MKGELGADGVQGLRGDLAARGPAWGAPAQRQGDVVADGQPQVQRPAVVLEDDGEPVGGVVDGRAIDGDGDGAAGRAG